jgi:hypothetical protein
MAKRADLTNLFAKTGGRAVDTSDLDAGNIRSTGVGLTTGEIAALDNLGRQLGELLDSDKVARNALIRIATRELLLAVLSGERSLGELAAYFERPEKVKPKLRF